MRRRREGKIFGIGLSRTGTTSLNFALERLGFRSIHFPCDPRTRQEIGGFLAKGGKRLRLSLLTSTDALTDTPVCATFEGLDAAYPGSRFVLTVREKAAWLRSCETYWRTGLEPLLRERPVDPFCVYIRLLTRALYGSDGYDRGRFSATYDAYAERVARHFGGRGRDLLVLDLFSDQGWSELCAFLDRPEPGGPFPFENRAVTEPTTSG